jgi:hypothetical protein
MTETDPSLFCQQCAKEKTNWAEHCPHAMEIFKNVYNRALLERPRPRLTSDDVRRTISGLSFTWANFYHLSADALNRILDEKEKNT